MVSIINLGVGSSKYSIEGLDYENSETEFLRVLGFGLEELFAGEVGPGVARGASDVGPFEDRPPALDLRRVLGKRTGQKPRLDHEERSNVPHHIVGADLFRQPLAFASGLGGMLLTGGLLYFGFGVLANAEETEEDDDEFMLEFEPGTLVKLGQEIEEKELPEKIIVQETRPEEDSPYMLLVAPVREARRTSVDDPGKTGLSKLNQVRSEVPAITHVDHSARVQTLAADRHPRITSILERFYARTGCPVIINTSFNVRGEPIVCTPSEAYRCFLSTNMDMLVIDNYVLYKNEQTDAQQHDVDAYLNQFSLD